MILIEACVLSARPFREYDQRVVLMTRSLGKISAVARGSLRPHSRQARALDVGNMLMCQLVWGKSPLPLVIGAQAQECWSGVKGTLVGLAALGSVVALADALSIEGDLDGQMWQWMHESLQALSSVSSEEYIAVVRVRQGVLVELLGYGARPIVQLSASRTSLDDVCDSIAQRRIGALDVLSAVVLGRQAVI